MVRKRHFLERSACFLRIDRHGQKEKLIPSTW